MEMVDYAEFQRRPKKYLRWVNQNRERLVVASKNPDDRVVVMAKDDYDAMMETLMINQNDYLMRKILRGEAQFREEQRHG